MAGPHLQVGGRADAFELDARLRRAVSARKCWALLRIERAGRLVPPLLRAYREALISWVQAQALVAIVETIPAHAEAWVAFARRVSVRRLRDDIDRALILADTDPEAFARSGGVPDLDAELSCETDEEARLQTGANSTDREETHLPGESAPRETARAFFTARREVARLFQATLCTVQRRLAVGGY